jgi:sortase A
MSIFVERALLVIGLCCLGWYGLAAADAADKEREARSAVERALAATDGGPKASPAPSIESTPPADAPPLAAAPLASAAGSAPALAGTPRPENVPSASARAPAPADDFTFTDNVVGLLEIPRLRFSTPVLEGDDSKTLRGAAGHLPDTPQPWEEGNSAIAAHRDGIFRPLRHIRIGDELRVQTPHGELRYKVSDTHIVPPTDLSVLDSKRPHMLTLITCYPFNYIGSAPQRFIVHAERIVE